ncbi:DEAD/DEAH box helicase [uncultured Methanobrevibacter sp.]|uniref:DEAD/DEAH box helicase n=1 Tax=uncultured Methanobrevibacter sp. TaxID=253161 RepID=UPI0025E1F83B|nr:DEAD/DEAH box helicase [uncultured Methanobrevibacter sp.]
MNFNDLNIPNELKDSINDMGFQKLTPIQKKAIPEALKGLDLIGQAQTGSGKTLAFAIPVLSKIFLPDKSPQAIILCPTRELCMQVADEVEKLGSKLKKFKVLAVYGGQPIGKQTRVLKKGVHVVVGTPGRVIDHIERGNLELIGVESVVLDEADEMLEMGFRQDIETILAKTPLQRQTLLFSATIPSEIKQIAGKYQKNPKFIKITDKKQNIPKIKQYAFKCSIKEKFDGLARLIEAYGVNHALIFCNTKKSVDYVAKHLKKQEFPVDSLHGDMTQKTRDKVMNKFRNGNIRILVATDVAARGLDIDDVDVIVNYDVPQNHDDYIHRIGRTARAGKNGMAFMLVSKDEHSRFNNIKKNNKVKIIEKELPTHDEINEIKNKQILDNARRHIEDDDLDDYVKVIRDNYPKKDYLKMAAGLLKMMREN